ncbi:MAG: glycosyltransferase [Bacteroidota bacterium]|nr:glycosyltransferase [Bacteroidota bacterium]
MTDLLFFWLPAILLLHSYIAFPAVLAILARRKRDNTIFYNQTDELPTVSVVISVYNEEKSIVKRIHNIYASCYPVEKLEVWVGSDGSTDRTNQLLKLLQKRYPSLFCIFSGQRQGKSQMLNRLAAKTKNEILIFSDAKVLFSPQAIFQLTKHFRNGSIGMVGGNIVSHETRQDGISIQENRFMSREISIKHNEGKLWGTVMGAYGACYAIRRNLYSNIPDGFSVDDFYVTLRTEEQGYKVIMEVNALCYEPVPNLMNEEFRRKVRISVGNFQNIVAFSHLLKKINPLSFCLFSHKLLRWSGPFLLIILFIYNLLIISQTPFFTFTFTFQALLMYIPALDFFLQKIRIHIIPLRFVTHFYSMNLALLIGFIKYTKGIKTNVWEPTIREY